MTDEQQLHGAGREPGLALAVANANEAASAERCAALEAELAALEPLVGAALLVTTAFRMRDEAGLIETLRLLTKAVAGVEERRARA